ncbi:MAG: oligosaccharide flippase family protein [Nanoarchaeota archaeon]
MLKKGKMLIKEGEKDIKEIYKRFWKRDFSGNTGQAIKNGTYNFSTTIVQKIGAIFFTIIIARLLMPELFGLYSLALATIGIFAVISDLGISSTLIRFLSKELVKNKPNPKGYYNYLLKIKFLLILFASLTLILSAYWVSNIYYDKPLFYALLAGGLYIFITGFLGFFESIYQSFNNFKKSLIKESIYQALRLVFIPLIIIFSLKFSNEILLLNILLGLSFCYLIALIFLFFKKPILLGKELNKKQKGQVNRFILPLTATALAGVFFANIDKIMLGHFVSAEFIGYYTVAFSLIVAVMGFLSFSGALFPIFSRLGGKELERGLRKSIKIVLPASFIIILITLIFSPLIIKIIYGAQYSLSINILRLFLPLIISEPIAAIYTNYYVSKGKTKLIAKLLISTALLNIILNYILIIALLPRGNLAAVFGAVIATVISRYVFLLGLIIFKRK